MQISFYHVFYIISFTGLKVFDFKDMLGRRAYYNIGTKCLNIVKAEPST